MDRSRHLLPPTASSCPAEQDLAGDDVPLQRNLRILYYLAGSRMLMTSWAYGPFLDLYLFELCGRSNRSVGLAETVRGTAQLAAGLVAGWLADRCSRTSMIKLAAVVRMVPTFLLFVGVASDVLGLVIAAMVGFATADALDTAARGALLMDCVGDGDRTLALAKQETCIWTAAGVGPSLQLVLVLALHVSDTSAWSVVLLRRVLQAGCCMYLLTDPPAFLLRHVPVGGGGATSTPGTGAGGGGDAALPDDWRDDTLCCGGVVRRGWFVAAWAEFQWLLTAVGAGLTLKFVPLFWREVVGLSPEGILLAQVAEAWGLALMNLVVPRISKVLGRARSCVFFVVTGALVLALFASVASLVPVPVAVILFMLRTSMSRAWVPCVQSIIMTCVPANRRGCWAALSSLKPYSFSLTSFLGGVIADSHGYPPAFLATAAVQGVAGLLCIPMVWWFAPAEKQPAGQG